MYKTHKRVVGQGTASCKMETRDDYWVQMQVHQSHSKFPVLWFWCNMTHTPEVSLVNNSKLCPCRISFMWKWCLLYTHISSSYKIQPSMMKVLKHFQVGQRFASLKPWQDTRDNSWEEHQNKIGILQVLIF